MTEYQNSLHEKAVDISARFRRCESELVDILQKIDENRVYRELSYPSVFAYTTQALRLSEAIACACINIARKSKQVPELKRAVDRGEVSLSKASRIVSVITPKNQEKLLSFAKTASKRDYCLRGLMTEPDTGTDTGAENDTEI